MWGMVYGFLVDTMLYVAIFGIVFFSSALIFVYLMGGLIKRRKTRIVLPLKFLIASLGYYLVAGSLGLLMGFTPNYETVLGRSFVSAHAHIALVGWVS